MNQPIQWSRAHHTKWAFRTFYMKKPHLFLFSHGIDYYSNNLHTSITVELINRVDRVRYICNNKNHHKTKKQEHKLKSARMEENDALKWMRISESWNKYVNQTIAYMFSIQMCESRIIENNRKPKNCANRMFDCNFICW